MTVGWRQLAAKARSSRRKIGRRIHDEEIARHRRLVGRAYGRLRLAADDKPAIVFDIGGKFDKSFNEAAFNGAEKFKTETGIAYGEFEIPNDAQREQALRNFAEDGYNPIVMAGFAWAAALEKVAAEYPGPQVRHHRHGGRQAERAVDRLQGA